MPLTAGFGGSANYDPSPGTASSSFTHWDGDTPVTETLRRHKGHEFTVTERIRVEDNRLIYKHEITGPGKKRDEREISLINATLFRQQSSMDPDRNVSSLAENEASRDRVGFTFRTGDGPAHDPRAEEAWSDYLSVGKEMLRDGK